MENKLSMRDDTIIGELGPDASNLKSYYSVSVCNKNAYAELENEFNLPEYMSEIQRLLRVIVTPKGNSKFVSENSVNISGTVEYNALYQGMDGNTYSATFESEYNISENFDNNKDLGEIMVTCDIYPESVLSRVSSERKINIKCKLCAKINAISSNELNLGEDIGNEDHIQKLIKSEEYCKEYRCESDEIVIREEMDLSGDDIRYITSDCKVFIESCEANEGYVECRGTLIIKSIVCKDSPDEIPYNVIRKVPFDEIVEISGIMPQDFCCAKGVCIGLEALENVNDSDDFNAGSNKIELVIKMILTAKAFKHNDINYVNDAYSTMYETENIFETYSLPKLLSCLNTNFTFNVSEEIKDTPFNPKTNDFRFLPIDTIAFAEVSTTEIIEDKCIINGSCRFNVIYTDSMSDNPNDIITNDIEMPFKYEISINSEDNTKDISSINCEINVCALNPRVRFDSEKVYLDCELLISGSVTDSKLIKAVTQMRIGNRDEKIRDGLTLCYPDSQDSLWSISKKYKAKVKDTAECNGLATNLKYDSKEILESVKYVII